MNVVNRCLMPHLPDCLSLRSAFGEDAEGAEGEGVSGAGEQGGADAAANAAGRVTEVGNVTPVEDFTVMCEDPSLVDSAMSQMVAVVKELLSAQSYDSAAKCLGTLRASGARLGRPVPFNTLLQVRGTPLCLLALPMI